MNQSQSFEQVLDFESKAIHSQYQHWLKYEVFTFQFWLLLAMLIVPWIIWWKLVDKKRLPELIIYGLLVITVATFLDEVGCQLNFWEYKVDIEPLFPRLIPINFTMLPVAYMLVYQYFSKWKSFITANVLMSAFFTFIGEPVFVALKIYVLLHWRHIFSFPLYIIIAVILRAITKSVMRIQQRAQGGLG